MRKHIPYPRRQFIRRILKSNIALAFGVLADIKVNGRENLPKAGPVIVVSNHFNFLDPLMVVRLVPYPGELHWRRAHAQRPGGHAFSAAHVWGHPHRARHCLARYSVRR